MLRRHPIEERKNGSLGCYNQGDFGISINHRSTRDGDVIYRHACAFGCGGIVSRRLGSAYRMVWLKTRHLLSPVRREREIDWSER
jgi:ATP-dependent DNA ligase